MMTLTAYSNVDWAGCLDSWHSTSGFSIYLRDNLISWSSNRQMNVARSNVEAEYRVVAHAMVKCYWVQQLQEEHHQQLRSATTIYYDNVNVVYMTSNLIHHHRTKHIEVII
jgi:hypothetical protein